MSRFKYLFIILTIFSLRVIAQAVDCPAIVQTALDTVDNACSATGRNEVCYGHALLNAVPQVDVTDFAFEQSGDIVNLASVDNLQLSAMNLDAATWGVALLKAQANLPDSLPGQNVTMVLFGDVQVDNLGGETVQIALKANAAVNVRQRPTTTTNNVIESLAAGEVVTANGKLSDGSWIRIVLENGMAGWVSADFLEGDSATLPIVSVSDAIVYGPMQAFLLQSGIGDSPCLEAPSSGILVQTPSGAGAIRLRVNGVDIRLGSTVYMQARAGSHLYVNVLEGKATLTADGQSQVVPQGTQARVPLGEDGLASGPPEFPEPYARLEVRDVPVDLLPDDISIARPVSTEDIRSVVLAASGVPQTSASPSTDNQAGNTSSGGNLPRGGRWTSTQTITQNTCDPAGVLPVGKVTILTPTIIFSEDRSTLIWDWGDGTSVTYFRTAENVYVVNYVNAAETITFTSPTTFTKVFYSEGGCIFQHDEIGTFVGG